MATCKTFLHRLILPEGYDFFVGSIVDIAVVSDAGYRLWSTDVQQTSRVGVVQRDWTRTLEKCLK
jgi:hypothetical protein